MAKRIQVYSFLGAATLLAVGGFFLYQFWAGSTAQAGTTKEAAKQADKSKTAEVPVEVHKVQRTSISSSLSATANLRALREVEIAGQLDGVVRSVEVEEGDFVKEGQILCRLDDSALKIRLQLTREKLAQARIQLEKTKLRKDKALVQVNNAKAEMERYDLAFQQKLVSEQSLAERRYKYEEFEEDVKVIASEEREAAHKQEELAAEIGQVELEIERSAIRAPFAGRVIERRVELGKMLRNMESAFKLGTFSPLFADVHLSEAQARDVRPGLLAVVRLDSDESRQIQAHVIRMSPVIEQATGTRKVIVEVPAATEGLYPGAFVRVEIITDTRGSSLVIPKKAIVEEDGRRLVFVVQGGQAVKTVVETGYEREGMVEVRAGIKAEDQVVTAGQGALKDKAKVKIIKGATPAAAA